MVEVGAALGAQALAVGAAQWHRRQRQQRVLDRQLVHHDVHAVVLADIRVGVKAIVAAAFTRIELALADEVVDERFGDDQLRGFGAAAAIESEAAVHGTLDIDHISGFRHLKIDCGLGVQRAVDVACALGTPRRRQHLVALLRYGAEFGQVQDDRHGVALPSGAGRCILGANPGAVNRQVDGAGVGCVPRSRARSSGDKGGYVISNLSARCGKRWFLGLLLAALGGGCRPAQVVDERAPAADLRPSGIVVLPVVLTIAESAPIEVALRTLDVANLLLRKTELPLIGPFDFELLKPLEDVHVAAYDTDLSARGDELGADWQGYVALHVLVTENRATNVRDITDTRIQDPKKPKVFRQHGVESELHVEASFYDVRRGVRLAWTAVDVADDPLDYEPGEDPRPGVTRAVRAAVERLLHLSQGQLQGQKGRRQRGAGLADSALAAAQWKTAEAPALLEAMRDKTDVDRQAKLLELWDRVQPGLQVGWVEAARRQRGVLVTQAIEPLHAGDIVTAVDDKPVAAVHQLDRRLQVCSDRAGGCSVQIVRGGATQTMQVRWPALPAVAPEP